MLPLFCALFFCLLCLKEYLENCVECYSGTIIASCCFMLKCDHTDLGHLLVWLRNKQKHIFSFDPAWTRMAHIPLIGIPLSIFLMSINMAKWKNLAISLWLSGCERSPASLQRWQGQGCRNVRSFYVLLAQTSPSWCYQGHCRQTFATASWSETLLMRQQTGTHWQKPQPFWAACLSKSRFPPGNSRIMRIIHENAFDAVFRSALSNFRALLIKTILLHTSSYFRPTLASSGLLAHDSKLGPAHFHLSH